MELELTTDAVRKWCLDATGEFHYKGVLNGTVSPELYGRLRKIIHDLVKDGTIKPCGRNDGYYKAIQKVEPVVWWNGDVGEPLDFRFPRSYDDDSSFGIEDMVEVFAGDLVLITGRSNYGKTTMALSILGENLGSMKGVLMGSEYTAANGEASPKFKRRMKRMDWANWLKDGSPHFDLLPVGADYEDYVEADKLNVIDWISLPGEYYLIDRVMKAIKDRVGRGVAVPVIQKNKDAEFGEGGERSERYADVVLKIDSFGKSESLLTIGRVKAPKGRATGRTFAFEIVDYGANLRNIREVVKCNNCRGKGYTGTANNYKRCSACAGLKYIERA